MCVCAFVCVCVKERQADRQTSDLLFGNITLASEVRMEKGSRSRSRSGRPVEVAEVQVRRYGTSDGGRNSGAREI